MVAGLRVEALFGALPCGDVTCSGLSSQVTLPAVTATTTVTTTTSSTATVTSSATNMASSASSMTPSTSNASSSPTNMSSVNNATNNIDDDDDDDAIHKNVVTQCQRACNGVIRNTSYPTLSSATTIPQSGSDHAVKKSVSTVFSSNNRNSWQLSLSNYSQEHARRDCPSPNAAAECHELQVRTAADHHQGRGSPPESTPADQDDVDASQHQARSQSKVFVYSGGPASKAVPRDDRKGFGQDGQLPGVGQGDGLSFGCRELVGCSSCKEAKAAPRHHGDGSGRRGSESPKPSRCLLLTEESGSRRASCSVQSPGYKPDTALTWSSHLEPHQLRQQTNTASNAVASLSHSHSHPPRPASCGEDCIELSLYQLASTSQPDIHSCDKRHPANQRRNPSGTTSQNCDQSVSVLRTSDQSGTVSFSSHGKRKDPVRTVRYSSDSDRNDSHHRRRSQHVEFGCEKRVRELGTLPTECPPDTQPLLYMPRVRVEGGSQSGSPDMCVDNTLVRFHSLDSKESYGKTGELERGPCHMQRAISVNTTTNLTLDTSHMLLSGYSASSPTGSESLAAPPLNELYRYHVFLSHCAQDVGWVQEAVARLQAPPFGYKCAYTPEVEQDRVALEQSLLCSAMLSERVVLVLSKQYVQETWFIFEKILRQLTQMSLHNQRIMGVLLEDCDIPDTLGELYFLDTSDPDFFDVFVKRLKTGRIPRSSESVSSDLAGRNSIAVPSVVNGQTLAQCTLAVKVGWDSYLQVADTAEELPPGLKLHGINLEKPEFYSLVENVSTVLNGSNKLPWVLCVQPLLVLLMAAALWLPAFIAVLAVQVDDNSGMALPVRLVVFVFPLGIVSCGYLLKWRRRYWLSKMVRVLVQNCVKANQVLYCEGKPVLTTAGHVRANNFAVYFIYFDLTDCVRSVDLLLFTCLEDDWDKLMRLVEFYARDKSYLSQVSMSERLTVMTGSAYLFKLVRKVLPHPPQQRHISGQLCLCQFTEECVTRFVHSLDREDVTALAELFTRHLFGYVSGSAVHRVNTEIFHRLH